MKHEKLPKQLVDVFRIKSVVEVCVKDGSQH